MALVLKNVKCVSPSGVSAGRRVRIAEGRIASIGRSEMESGPGDRIVDGSGGYLLPGFIDIHIHGAMGGNFLDPDFPVQEILSFCHARGVTGVLATVGSQPKERILSAIERMARKCEAHAALLGIHCEGPFINRRLAGGFVSDYCVEPDIEWFRRMVKAAAGRLRIVTLSPEQSGAFDIIREARASGVLVSAGHSEASYELTEQAVEAGLSLVTHVFNAMQPLHHRRPGILLASLLKPEILVQLNADGVHVHPLVMKMLYRLKGPEKIVFGSDATLSAGLPDGDYVRQGQHFSVRDGTPRTEDGTIMGATTSLDTAVKVMVERTGVPLAEAAQMASLNAARLLGLEDRKGTVAEGMDADLVLMDERLSVRMTLLGGEVVYEAE